MEKRRRNRLDEVIDTAYRLFCEKGYETTSISDLCEATQLTTAGLYHYIKSKEDLLNKVDVRYYQRIKEVLLKERTKRSPEEDLREFIGDITKGILQDKNVVHFLISRAFAEGALWAEAKARRKEITGIVRNKLREIKPFSSEVDIKTAAFVLIGMVTWASLWYSAEGPMSIDELADRLSGLFMRGFLAEHGTETKADDAGAGDLLGST